MMITITPGIGTALRFQDFTPQAPILVSANLRALSTLAPIAQLETLASAYVHLSGVAEANQQLLESLGQLVQRMNAREERTAADSFIVSRLIGEWGSLKDSVPPSSPPQPRSDRPAEAPIAMPKTPVPPTPAPPSPVPGVSGRRRSERNDSIQFYTDGKGGLFPPSWVHFSKEMKNALKIAVWNLSATDSRALISSEEANATFLMGTMATWILQLRNLLTETGAKGAGRSGLASGPSIRGNVELINEMSAFMSEGDYVGSPLADAFWRAYGTHTESRMAVNRLTSMRSLLSSLDEAERNALEDSLYALDTHYLAWLLSPLASRSDPGLERGFRDVAHGDQMATMLGEKMNGLPTSLAALDHEQRAQLSSLEAILRTVEYDARTVPPTPGMHAFLLKLLPSEMIRVASFVEMLREKR